MDINELIVNHEWHYSWNKIFSISDRHIIPLGNISGKSEGFTCNFSRKEVEKSQSIRGKGSHLGIFNHFKKKQHFFHTPIGTFAIKFGVNAVVLKKLKMWNVYHIRMDAWTDRRTKDTFLFESSTELWFMWANKQWFTKHYICT